MMLLASIGMSWVAVRMQMARRQREAVEAIERLGVWVDYELAPPAPGWLCGLVGHDLFADVVHVSLGAGQYGMHATDAAMEHLAALTELKERDAPANGISDAGVKHIAGLTKLQILRFYGAEITDSGLLHLTRLTQLRELRLECTGITDVGLEVLRSLRLLEDLNLANTNLTDAGLEHLCWTPKTGPPWTSRTRTSPTPGLAPSQE